MNKNRPSVCKRLTEHDDYPCKDCRILYGKCEIRLSEGEYYTLFNRINRYIYEKELTYQYIRIASRVMSRLL
jgi:hypothetical protein